MASRCAFCGTRGVPDGIVLGTDLKDLRALAARTRVVVEYV